MYIDTPTTTAPIAFPGINHYEAKLTGSSGRKGVSRTREYQGQA